MKKHKPYCNVLDDARPNKCNCKKKSKVLIHRGKDRKPPIKIDPTLPTRGYFLVNQYISGIQCGIQSAHCALALVANAHASHKTLRDWWFTDKTMIVLNGGYQKNLEEIYDTISNYNKFIVHRQPQDEIHFAKFHEEQDALNGALTCVGFVLPGWMIELARNLKEKTATSYGGDANTLNTCQVSFAMNATTKFMPGYTIHEGLASTWYEISNDLATLLAKLNGMSSAR